jgi:predicted N-formylglutamate amidohydrolase
MRRVRETPVAGRALILSCEHGGHRVPAAYRRLFRGASAALASHRGWDPGALDCARRLAKALSAPLYAATTTRLLVDLNRSLDHPRLLSPWSTALSDKEREQLLERHYHPHRNQLRDAIHEASGSAVVLHLAVHSFAPRLKGRERNADVGLLYDPARRLERLWCGAMKGWLRQQAPDLRVRRNYPYLGRTDGLTTSLRRELVGERYLGIELELNQRLATDPRQLRRVSGLLARGIDRLWLVGTNSKTMS